MAVKKSNENLIKFAQNLDKRMKNSGTQFLNPEDIDRRYGVSSVISSGLPSLDLQLYCLRDEDGYNQYGFPTGRIVEVVGSEHAGKSLLANQLLAHGRRAGGMVFKISSERDFDISWDKKFFVKAGLDWEKDVVNINGAKDPSKAMSAYLGGTATTLEEMAVKFANVMTTMRSVYGDGLGSPPSVIVLDSLASLMSNDELDRWNNQFVLSGRERKVLIGEDGTTDDVVYKIGTHQRTLWNFFKSVLEDIARYNTLFFMTNQYRASMDKYAKGTGIHGDQKSAHDASVRYMSSLRIRLDKSASTKDVKSAEQNRNYFKWRTIEFSVKKLRGDGTNCADKQYLHLSQDGGVDYLYSLVDSFFYFRFS